MSVITISLPPISGEFAAPRQINIDRTLLPRRWAFIHPSGESTVKSSTRTQNEYAFSNILFSELYTGQQFLSASTTTGPGTAQQRNASFSVAFATDQDAYPAIAAFSKAYVSGNEVQMIVVDQLEGGLRSTEAIGVKGQIIVFISTPTYVLARFSLSAFCSTYRIFTQAVGKAVACSGNLDGGCYDFKGSSTDASKEPLKTLVADTRKAIENGLTGGPKATKQD